MVLVNHFIMKTTIAKYWPNFWWFAPIWKVCLSTLVESTLELHKVLPEKKILDGLFYFEYLMDLMWCLLNLEIELMLITSQHWLIISSRNDTNHTKVRKRRKIVVFTVYGFETNFFTVYCFEGLNFTVYCFGDPPLHPLCKWPKRLLEEG